MFTNKIRCSIIWKGNALEEWWIRKDLVLIKSLIYAREEKDALEARSNKIDQSRLKLSADNLSTIVRLGQKKIGLKPQSLLFAVTRCVMSVS